MTEAKRNKNSVEGFETESKENSRPQSEKKKKNHRTLQKGVRKLKNQAKGSNVQIGRSFNKEKKKEKLINKITQGNFPEVKNRHFQMIKHSH